MPSIKKDFETEIEIDFEVFCGTCGAGICGNTTTRESRRRGHAQVVVDVCDDCIKKKDEDINELQEEVSSLNTEIEELKNRISELESQLANSAT